MRPPVTSPPRCSSSRPGGPNKLRAVPVSLQSRAREALALRLRQLTPSGALHTSGAHTLQIADALIPSLGSDDVAWIHAQLAARAKGELRPSRAGTVQAHAAWSSTALVASAFAPWRDRLPGLALEARLHIPHGGGTPNLDVAFDGCDGLVGVESKLTEHLVPARARAWRPAYRRPAMAAELQGGWAAIFADLLEGRTPRFLDAGQLVRHALSLRRAGNLVLLYWEPANAEDHPEILAHRQEVADLIDRVGDARPRLHAFSWSHVFDSWATAIPEHVAALRARYDVPVAPADDYVAQRKPVASGRGASGLAGKPPAGSSSL